MAKTGGACFYCGYAATDLDHIVPRSYVANDTEDNLVPSCGICNNIAGNQHFENLQAKKEYILEERASARWQRKLARMVVTIIQPGYAEPETDKASVKSSDVVELEPVKNPFRSAPIQPSDPKPRKKTIKPVWNDQPASDESNDELYRENLVNELIELIDNLTDEQVDDMMSALIERDKERWRIKQNCPPAADVVYGRDALGRIRQITLEDA